jgi:hypothetical protein
VYEYAQNVRRFCRVLVTYSPTSNVFEVPSMMLAKLSWDVPALGLTECIGPRNPDRQPISQATCPASSQYASPLPVVRFWKP